VVCQVGEQFHQSNLIDLGDQLRLALHSRCAVGKLLHFPLIENKDFKNFLSKQKKNEK